MHLIFDAPGDVPEPDPGAGQREQWSTTFEAHPLMYGVDPSNAGRYAVELFARAGARAVLELGAGQGRDTAALAAAGFAVTALDYAPSALAQLRAQVGAQLAPRLTTVEHDVRAPLPLADASVDAVYAHMLFCMALRTPELVSLAGEVHRVLRPGGYLVYTVRHTGDAHFRAGTSRGDGMWENGGFVVHFFDRALVDTLASGFALVEVDEFLEGDLPRRLWRVTQRREGAP